MTTAAIIIPVYNEAGSLPAVLDELAAMDWPVAVEVVVVDGGSTDGTPDLARAAGLRVVVERRRGYGRACAAGSAATDADVLVYMDGDGSTLASDVPALLAPLLAGRADLVLGSRAASGVSLAGMPFQQRFGNWLSSVLIGLIYGLRLTDLGPFRAVRREVVNALDVRNLTYGWPTEMLVKAIRAGYRVVEVPVSFRARLDGQSKISGTLRGTLLAGWHILSATLRYIRWTPS